MMGSWLGGGSSGVVELVEGVSGGASGRGGCRATAGASVCAPACSMMSGIAAVASSMVWAIQLLKVRLSAAARCCHRALRAGDTRTCMVVVLVNGCSSWGDRASVARKRYRCHTVGYVVHTIYDKRAQVDTLSI